MRRAHTHANRHIQTHTCTHRDADTHRHTRKCTYMLEQEQAGMTHVTSTLHTVCVYVCVCVYTG